MSSETTKQLEARVQYLEAEWGIRNLIATYLLRADVRDAEGVAGTFAKDGVLDIAGLHVPGLEETTYKGRKAIAKLFREVLEPAPCFMWHLGHTPYIEVHGDKATGHWGWTALVRFPDSDAMEMGGVYDDKYVKTDEGWKIKKKVITGWYFFQFGKWDSQRFFGPTT
jgi:SnoaL-like domain